MLLDAARPLDFGQRERGLGLDPHRRGNLPALAQFAGGILASAFGGHAGLALFAGEVFGTDRAGLGGRQAKQVAKLSIQAIELGGVDGGIFKLAPGERAQADQ